MEKQKETKPNLWDLTKDSLHVKFFQWMWGIYAPTKYKTACPYYWQFAGSILILPLILITKLIGWLVKPVVDWFDEYTDRKAKEYVDALLIECENLTFDKDFYTMYKSKCYKKYRWSLTYEQTQKIWMGYENYVQYLKDEKLKRQIKIDNIRYGAVGTIVSYAIGFTLLYLIGWGGYSFVHLFTWTEFVGFCKGLGIMIVIISVFIGIVKSIGWMIKKCWAGSWVSRIVFWKYIGMGFSAVWTGIKMTGSMIKSVYTNSCPTINWK